MKTMLDIINDNKNAFIKYFNSTVTYHDFIEYVNGIAAQFSMYCDKNDTVAMISENIPQFIMCEYASWKNHCIFLPLSPLDSPIEMEEKIQFIKPKIIVISSEFKDNFYNLEKYAKIIYTDPETFSKLPENFENKFLNNNHIEELNLRKKAYFELYNIDSEDVAVLMFTSGTTGRPKAAVIRHKNIYAASFIYKEWFNVHKNDVNLAIAPFFHITGLIFGISLSVISNSAIAIDYRFGPDNALKTIINNKTSITMFVATAYRSMINSWKNIPDIKKLLSSMRLWSAGGMPMPLKTENEWKAMTGKYIYMAYGLTESTSPLTLWEYPYNKKLKVYNNIVSAGKPVYYTIIRKGRDNELIANGPQVISEYYDNEIDTGNTFTVKGMKTGDIFYMDSDSYIYIIDRKKDLIDISGYKVWPAEIENVVRQDNRVEDVVVVPKKDEYRGEIPVAYVKLLNGINVDNNIKDNLIALCKLKLSKYKIPEIKFIDKMPVSATGKIKRSDIYKIIGEEND